MKTKIINIFNWRRFLAFMVLAILIIISINYPLDAQTVTSGYNSDSKLQRGMIVSLNKDDKNKIDAVTKDNAKNTYGVIVSANDAPVTLSEEGQNYFVATIGKYDVLVSNQNGNIKTGDYITVSAVPGIGMKADSSNKYAVGRALADYDASKNIVSKAKLKDGNGKEFEVAISRIEAQISIGANPSYKSSTQELPGSLKHITDAVAGKSVGALRGYVALAVFILSTIAAGSLMYGGVKSAIISVGRNPLSKKSIVKSMLQVVASGLIIFITGIIGVYLILKL